MRKIMPDVVADQRLLSLPATATMREAAVRMAERDVRSVVIATGDRLEGIFTGTDLIRAIARGADPDATPLSAVMTRAPRTIEADETAIEGLRRMVAGSFRHLPVMREGRLVGVVSRRDFLGYEVDEIEHQGGLWERL